MRHKLPSLWKVALVVLAVVVLAEGAILTREHRLTPPKEWYHPRAAQYVAEAQQIRSGGHPCDVLFVGTSMVASDVQVEIVEEELDGVEQARNAALPAAQTPVMRRWLLEEMLPRLSPPRVVWGVSSLDFNGNRAEPTLDQYNTARATAVGWVGAVDRLLGDLLALSHHRLTLRDPATLGALLGLGGAPERGGAPTRGPDRLLAPINRLEEPADLETAFRQIKAEVLHDWSIGAREAEAFLSTIDEMQGRGIEVVVVLMPVPDTYVEAHPNGEADFDEFLGFIGTALDAAGVRYFDYSRDFGDEEFRDVTHLLAEPAGRFTVRLSSDLAGLGW